MLRSKAVKKDDEAVKLANLTPLSVQVAHI
jgi:hypothetical protein